MNRKKIAGITLVELMIAVAIIVVLAAIALPAYEAQVQKSRRTDGRAALTTIALAEERFFTVNGAYTTSLAALDINDDLSDGDSAEEYYALSINTANSNSTFRITGTAQGGQTSDDDCDTMTIDSLGVKDGTPANTHRCW